MAKELIKIDIHESALEPFTVHGLRLLVDIDGEKKYIMVKYKIEDIKNVANAFREVADKLEGL